MMLSTFFRKLCVLIVLVLTTVALHAQTTSISGTVTDEESNTLAGVNVIVKGKVIGTITDFEGYFSLQVSSPPPFTIQISFIGFATQEIEITEEVVSGLEISLVEQAIMGNEIVISANRVPQKALESPVTIENMDIIGIRSTASDDYYKSIANLKGVDMVQSSINFQTVNTRGFNSTSNTRFVQLIDGMDSQAPALNFPIGSLNGPSELDIESIELIPGAASALYGPSAFNGIMLITSKSPFEYQGLSATTKLGFNHMGEENLNSEDIIMDGLSDTELPSGMKPMYSASLRYAKAFNNKFAFKVNLSYSRAEDWYGTDLRDRGIGGVTPVGFSHNPGKDRMHAYGDEVATNISLLAASSDFVNTVAQIYGDPDYVNLLPSLSVSRTPYREFDIVDHGAENLKINTALHYRLSDNYELSYTLNYGSGTSIYNGAQRYSLANFNIQQHKVELKSNNFFIRGYTTIEDSGDSYIAELTSVIMNESWKSSSQWFGEYGIAYIGAKLQSAPDETAHLAARGFADTGRLIPGTAAFEAAKDGARLGTIPNGSRFADNTRLWQVDTQYDLSEYIEGWDVLVGGMGRMFELRSNGTIFPDTEENPITILELGAFGQVSKSLADDKLRLSGSLRYDKNENFDGQLTPRISAVIKPAADHNIRISYQTGFRNPSTQGQHIDLNVLTARLLGGLQYQRDQYNIFENAYTVSSVNDYIEGVSADLPTFGGASLANPKNLNKLMRVTDLPVVKPEQVKALELGYKAVIGGRFLFDVVGYYNIYNDFIVQIPMRKASGVLDHSVPEDQTGEWVYHPSTEQNIRNASTLLTPISESGKENTFSTYTNLSNEVKAQGVALGLSYSTPSKYNFGFNYNWNKLISEDFATGVAINDYNTPEHKMNLMFSNREVFSNVGFNVVLRWQSDFRWEGTFGRGQVPAYTSLDAQVSFKLESMKSYLKVGGSNLFNNVYTQSFGGPTIGGIYYLSLTFDQLFN